MLEKWFKMLKEDSMQIPSQRSRIPSFRLEGLVMHSNTHQHLEDSNSSRLYLSGRCSNASGRSSEFDKKPNFLHRHKYGKKAASVRMTGQHRPDAILDKARHGEELQSSGRHSNIVNSRSLLWYLRGIEVQRFGC
jgi:hypothetical protein